MPAMPAPAPAPEGDTSLLRRAVAGDLSAFESLYRRHLGAARWVAQRWTTSPHDVDDLVAESFARVLRALPRLDPQRVAFRPYLLACVRNAAHDWARRPGRLEFRSDVPEPPPAGDVQEASLPGCETLFMGDALDTLPRRWRDILWLTAVEGRTPTEIARATGSTPGTIAAVAYRARHRLRTAYLAAHTSRPCPPDATCPACRTRATAMCA